MHIPVVLHRPLPVSGTFPRATVEAKKVGFNLEWNLLVCVNFPPATAPSDGAHASITLGGNPDNPKEFGSLLRDDEAEFRQWARGTNGQKFDWITPENKLVVNSFVDVADERSKGLDYTVGEYFKHAIDDLKTLVPTVKMPAWFRPTEFSIDRRRSIRRLYQVWQSQMITRAEAISRAQGEEVRQAFKLLRQEALLMHPSTSDGMANEKRLHQKMWGLLHPKEGEEKYPLAFDWDFSVQTLALLAESSLHLSEGQAQVLAIITLAVERYEHLYPWAVNLRSRSLSRRKDEYRQFAVHFLKGVKVLHILDAKVKDGKKKQPKRFLSKNDKAMAVSYLIDALENVAQREGITVEL